MLPRRRAMLDCPSTRALLFLALGCVAAATILWTCTARSTWISARLRLRTAASPRKQDRSDQSTLDVQLYDDGLFVSAAFLDSRGSPPDIKVTAYFRRGRGSEAAIFCRYGEHVSAARVHEVYDMSWAEGDELWQAGYLLCPAPTSALLLNDSAATAVATTMITLAGSNGTPSVQLPIRLSIGPRSELQPSGVFLCAKSLYGSVDALRLVEWIELNLLIGVRHMYVYSLGINEEATRALEHYASLGVVTLIRDNSKQQIESALPRFERLFANRDATHASGAEPIVQLELLSVHDCLYRYGAAYEYAVVCDTDEVLVPQTVRTLPELAALVRGSTPGASSFLFHAAPYLTAFETATTSAASAANSSQSAAAANEKLHMLRYTKRGDIGWDGRKSLHSMLDTLLVDQHERQHPRTGNVQVEHSAGWVHHYRNACKGGSCSSNFHVTDDGPEVMGRYAADLRRQVLGAAAQLGRGWLLSSRLSGCYDWLLSAVGAVCR